MLFVLFWFCFVLLEVLGTFPQFYTVLARCEKMWRLRYFQSNNCLHINLSVRSQRWWKWSTYECTIFLFKPHFLKTFKEHHRKVPLLYQLVSSTWYIISALSSLHLWFFLHFKLSLKSLSVCLIIFIRSTEI